MRLLPLIHFRIKVNEEGIKGHPAMSEEAAVVEDVEKNGRGGQGVGTGWENSVDRLALPYVMLLGALELFAENDVRVYAT